MGIESHKGYFYNPKVVAKKEKAVLEELVTILTTVTTNNTEITDTIKSHGRKLSALAETQQLAKENDSVRFARC